MSKVTGLCFHLLHDTREGAQAQRDERARGHKTGARLQIILQGLWLSLVRGPGAGPGAEEDRWPIWDSVRAGRKIPI